MENNETVEQVLNMLVRHSGFPKVADRIMDAHKRELAEKDAGLKTVTLNYENVIAYMDNLVAGMKACRDGECERIKFGAELCDGCHWQLSKNALEAKDAEIASLRSLVKKLADSLEPFSEIYCMRCYKYVEGKCTATKSDKCFSIDRKKLIAKAREVVK